LFGAVIKGIESMKKLRLRALLARDKLYVIYKQNVHFAKTVSEIFHSFKAKGINKFVREFLCRYITNSIIGQGVMINKKITYGVK
jgi:hypothetical protein